MIERYLRADGEGLVRLALEEQLRVNHSKFFAHKDSFLAGRLFEFW
jgi:hypothetical protein